MSKKVSYIKATKCPICNLEKDEENDFYFSSEKKRQRYCKECSRIYHKKWMQSKGYPQKKDEVLLKFVIEGTPIAKKRPRFLEKSVIDIQKKEKKTVQFAILSQMGKHGVSFPLEGSISINMYIYTKIPKSWSEKKKTALFAKPDMRKPDIDNYVKFYFDCMNNFVIHDDSQITELFCKKVYSDEPRIVIWIKKLTSNNDLSNIYGKNFMPNCT